MCSSQQKREAPSLGSALVMKHCLKDVAFFCWTLKYFKLLWTITTCRILRAAKELQQHMLTGKNTRGSQQSHSRMDSKSKNIVINHGSFLLSGHCQRTQCELSDASCVSFSSVQALFVNPDDAAVAPWGLSHCICSLTQTHANAALISKCLKMGPSHYWFCQTLQIHFMHFTSNWF